MFLQSTVHNTKLVLRIKADPILNKNVSIRSISVTSDRNPTSTGLQKKRNSLVLVTDETFRLDCQDSLFPAQALTSPPPPGMMGAPTNTRLSYYNMLRNFRGKKLKVSFPIIPTKMPRIESYLINISYLAISSSL